MIRSKKFISVSKTNVIPRISNGWCRPVDVGSFKKSSRSHSSKKSSKPNIILIPIKAYIIAIQYKPNQNKIKKLINKLIYFHF